MAPSADELLTLLPLPSTAAFQPARALDPYAYGGLAMLRRVARDAVPHRGFTVHWDVLAWLAAGHPQHLLWQPLMALSLFANPVLQLYARYRIEPRRRTDKLFDSVEWEVVTLDEETEIERPRIGGFDLDTSAVSRLRRFLEELAPYLTAALDTQAAKKAKRDAKEEAANRLQRCAEHFLTADEHAYDEGEVMLARKDDAVLHYVIALEGLLAGGDVGDLTRKVSQRAAILAGINDADRLAIRKRIYAAYGARSEYAHGDKPDKIRNINLAELRRVVCRCLLTPEETGP